jgi:hypothetical protein
VLRKFRPKSIKPAVKLFPRLATARATPKFVRLDRPLVGDRRGLDTPTTKRDAEVAVVRARLLRMILDNERDRHSGWRPSAS